jgi:hypothetical protein
VVGIAGNDTGGDVELVDCIPVRMVLIDFRLPFADTVREIWL